MAFVIVDQPNVTPMATHRVDVPQGTTIQDAVRDWAAGNQFAIGTTFYIVDPANVMKYTLRASFQAN